MTILRLSRRTAAWLATASLVLNAAWPLLANAKPSVAAPSSEICSATGLNHAAGGAPAGPREKDLRASHCTLCPFGAERCAAIPHVEQPQFPSAPAPAPAFALRDAPQAQAALRLTAPPRAPPFLS